MSLAQFKNTHVYSYVNEMFPDMRYSYLLKCKLDELLTLSYVESDAALLHINTFYIVKIWVFTNILRK